MKYEPRGNVVSDAEPVEDDPSGCWICHVDKNINKHNAYPFLEVHRSAPFYYMKPEERYVVFRISNYIFKGITLGECVLLNKEQVTQIRDHLNELLQEMELANKRS